MKVKLIANTPIDVAYFSARTCYSSISPIEMKEKDCKTEEEKIEFIKKILKTGHYSTVEGINITFMIENVSRSLLAQFTRHRCGIQFSVQSQRYVKYNDNNYGFYIPPTIKDKNLELYNDFQKQSFDVYKKLVDNGVKAEDARYVLTNATYTNITTTINLRELIHIMHLRKCSRASLEIRKLMNLMSDEVVKIYPWLKDYLVASCDSLGYCPEGKGCGKYPSLQELIDKNKK